MTTVTTCPDCGNTWSLSDLEVERYISLGFTVPRRCGVCRAVRRFERDGREYTITNCDSCGARCAVPFAVRPGREIRCSECFEKEHS